MSLKRYSYLSTLAIAVLILLGGNSESSAKNPDLSELILLAKIDEAKILIAEDEGLTDRDPHGFAPIHYAARNGLEEIVSLLLDAGVSPDQATKDDQTPLQIVARDGHADEHVMVAELLLQAGADISMAGTDGWKALHHAAAGGHLGISTLLLNHGAVLESSTLEGDTVLLLAARSGRRDLLLDYIRLGANIEHTNMDGHNVVHMAAWNGQSDIISKLAEIGADLNKETPDGHTALHLALLQEEYAVASQLLKLGAQVRAIPGSMDDYMATARAHEIAASHARAANDRTTALKLYQIAELNAKQSATLYTNASRNAKTGEFIWLGVEALIIAATLKASADAQANSSYNNSSSTPVFSSAPARSRAPAGNPEAYMAMQHAMKNNKSNRTALTEQALSREAWAVYQESDAPNKRSVALALQAKNAQLRALVAHRIVMCYQLLEPGEDDEQCFYYAEKALDDIQWTVNSPDYAQSLL